MWASVLTTHCWTLCYNAHYKVLAHWYIYVTIFGQSWQYQQFRPNCNSMPGQSLRRIMSGELLSKDFNKFQHSWIIFDFCTHISHSNTSKFWIGAYILSINPEKNKTQTLIISKITWYKQYWQSSQFISWNNLTNLLSSLCISVWQRPTLRFSVSSAASSKLPTYFTNLCIACP